jgi:hypothetical protein
MQRRKIKIKENQYIGSGDYGIVYRISKTKVVKVPHYYRMHVAEKLIKDEIRGSKTQKFALPVLEVVDVIMPDGDIRPGIIRRYVPFIISPVDFEIFLKENKSLKRSWDARRVNFRKDSKGKFWRVDTQTVACHDLEDPNI